MRSTLAAFLLALALPTISGAGSPFIPSPGSGSSGPIFLTSPGVKTAPAPAQPAVWTLTVKQFRWLYIDDAQYTGPITFDGADSPAVKIFPAKAGVSYPGWKEGDSDWNEHIPPVSKNEVFFVGGKAQGIVNITAWGIRDGKPAKLGLITLNVGGAPQPKPDDPKPIDPDIKPVTKSFRVIFVYESANPPIGAAAFPWAESVEEYVRANTTPESNMPGFRRYDKDVDASNDSPTFAALWAAVKPKLTQIPCLVIERDGKVDILPWPKDAADCLVSLKKYRGK